MFSLLFVSKRFRFCRVFLLLGIGIERAKMIAMRRGILYNFCLQDTR